MKIGILISSITKNIPYMTYLVSLGYEVFPIILSDAKDNKFKSVVEAIANRNIFDNSSLQEIEKLDCLMIMADTDAILSLENLDYNLILKEGAPIILNMQQALDESHKIFSYPNLYIISCNSINVIENCNEIGLELEKTLKKK